MFSSEIINSFFKAKWITIMWNQHHRISNTHCTVYIFGRSKTKRICTTRNVGQASVTDYAIYIYRWVVGLLGGRPAPEWDEVGVTGESIDWRPKPWWWWWCTLRYGVRGTTGNAGVVGRLPEVSRSPLNDEFQDITLSCKNRVDVYK